MPTGHLGSKGDFRRRCGGLCSASPAESDPPLRMVLAEFQHRARDGSLPFDAEFVGTFEVESRGAGTKL